MVNVYKHLKAPLNAQIEVTGACPNLCQHCYNYWREKEETLLPTIQSGALTPLQARKIVQKLGNVGVFNLVVTGGEPLVNMPASIECLETACEVGISPNMNSSLVPITAERATRLRKAGLKHILTSILGPSEMIHDNLTQKHGSFKALVRGIHIANDAGISVSANMVVSLFNLGTIRATGELLAKLGVKKFSATKAGCPGNCSDFSHLKLNRSQVVEFLNELCWCNKNLGIEVDTLEPIPFCGLVGVEKPELFTNRRCVAGITTMTVSYDGSVRACSHFDVPSGNILLEEFSTVWDRMIGWSKDQYIPESCRSCPILYLCGAGCRMEAKTSGGGISNDDPFTSRENTATIIQYLKGVLRKSETLKDICGFRTVKFRVREESFGGVVALPNSQWIFVDTRGYKVLKQLNPCTIYKLPLSIDWRGLDPVPFVTGLIQRNVVIKA